MDVSGDSGRAGISKMETILSETERAYSESIPVLDQSESKILLAILNLGQGCRAPDIEKEIALSHSWFSTKRKALQKHGLVRMNRENRPFQYGVGSCYVFFLSRKGLEIACNLRTISHLVKLGSTEEI